METLRYLSPSVLFDLYLPTRSTVDFKKIDILIKLQKYVYDFNGK